MLFVHITAIFHLNIMNLFNVFFFLDCGQQLDHPSSGQALFEDTQSMDTTEIEKIFLTTAYQVSLKVLNGLDGENSLFDIGKMSRS